MKLAKVAPPSAEVQREAWKIAVEMVISHQVIPLKWRWKFSAACHAGPENQNWESVCLIHVLHGRITP